jgi:hypothetical protein
MRLTSFDRYLLVGCLLCLLMSLVCGQASSAPTCDNNCRQVQWYYDDLGTGVIPCYYTTLNDCTACWFAGGNCNNKNAKLPGTCQQNNLQQQKRGTATGCTLLCTLAPNGYAEASAGTIPTTVNVGWFTCQ